MTRPLGEVPMTMRMLTAAAVFFFFHPAGQPAAQADPDHPVAGGGTIPAGWDVRTQPKRPSGQPAAPEDVKVSNMGDGPHPPLGPPAVYWRGRATISGNY